MQIVMTLVQVFSCEFCKMFMNNFFYRASLNDYFYTLLLNSQEKRKHTILIDGSF